MEGSKSNSLSQN